MGNTEAANVMLAAGLFRPPKTEGAFSGDFFELAKQGAANLRVGKLLKSTSWREEILNPEDDAYWAGESTRCTPQEIQRLVTRPTR